MGSETGSGQDRYPRSRLDKLGVKPGLVVSVRGVDDEEFLRELHERVPDATIGRIARHSDLVVFGVAKLADLARLAALAGTIARNGAIWAVWRKGQPALKEDHIRAAAIRAGLVDVKVMAFSATLSGLKLVIPLARR